MQGYTLLGLYSYGLSARRCPHWLGLGYVGAFTAKVLSALVAQSSATASAAISLFSDLAHVRHNAKMIRTCYNHCSVFPGLNKLKQEDGGTGLIDSIKSDLFVAHMMATMSAMGAIALRNIHDRVERAHKDTDS